MTEQEIKVQAVEEFIEKMESRIYADTNVCIDDVETILNVMRQGLWEIKK